MDKIQRTFIKKRGDFILRYDFTTLSHIFKETDDKLFKYLHKRFITDKPKREASVTEFIRKSKKFPLLRTKKVKNDILDIARNVDYEGAGRRQHAIMQNYFFEHDRDCIALEMPVYNEELEGFVDIIRYQKPVVQILDFKPKADKEKNAAKQLWLYREMFCRLSCYPKEMVECYYFDNKYCYQVLFN